MKKQSEYYLKPKKKFSQNFLIDPNIARKIASAIEANDDDCVIEIGCGTGALTQYLLEKNTRLIGTEIDARAIEILKKKFPEEEYPYFRLMKSDVLEMKLTDILLFPQYENSNYEFRNKNKGIRNPLNPLLRKGEKSESFNPSDEIKVNDYRNPLNPPLRKGEKTHPFIPSQDGRMIVVGNIPYKISSEIFFWIFEQSTYIKKVVLMVQKEVARRLTAKPKTKEYGILTVAMELAGECKKLFDVPPTCFNPQPKVTSSVIEMRLLATFKIKEFGTVMELVRSAFNQRRKTLRNSLFNFINKKFNYDKEKISNFIFDNNEKYFNKRAEELSTTDYIELNNLINNMK